MEATLTGTDVFFILVTLWSLPWKGYALWHASKLNHKKWFIVLLIINTAAILDIIYIYFVVRKAKQARGETADKQEIPQESHEENQEHMNQ